MTEPFSAIQISDNVYWVGAVDWGIRNFHGYLTSRGTTYNAFIVLADKITLIDTVKAPFYDEMISRIRNVVDPAKIDIVISNHSEMDHSGALPRFLHSFPGKTLFASKKGQEALDRHFHWNQEVRTVKTGDRISLGNNAVSFVEAPMLHWPDSMFTFLENQKILFTNDGFGMHLASVERFADQIDPSLLRYEAAKYYANILLPFSKAVANQLSKLPSFDLDIQMIAPDHGPIFRENVEQPITWYAKWSQQKPGDKAVIVYDTMWQSTEKMARALCDGLTEGGAKVSVMPLSGAHRSDVATEILDAGALLVGSPTMNNQIYPTVADAMTYLKGLKRQNLIGGAFGSFGWSGQATRHLEAMLDEMKIERVHDSISCQYVPCEEDLAACRSMGLAVAKKLKATSAGKPS
jgi:flavorubredoxin